MSQAVFSYAPGSAVSPAYTYTRATTATYVNAAADTAFHYWSGQLHITATFTRATAATYVNENRYPESD